MCSDQMAKGVRDAVLWKYFGSGETRYAVNGMQDIAHSFALSCEIASQPIRLLPAQPAEHTRVEHCSYAEQQKKDRGGGLGRRSGRHEAALAPPDDHRHNLHD